MIPSVEVRQVRPCFSLHRSEHPDHTCAFFGNDGNSRPACHFMYTVHREGMHWWIRGSINNSSASNLLTCEKNFSLDELADLASQHNSGEIPEFDASELKSGCPICGKIPDCVEENFGQDPGTEEYYGYWSITCEHTSLKDKYQYDFDAPDDDHWWSSITIHAGSKEAAITGWNTRYRFPDIPQCPREMIEKKIELRDNARFILADGGILMLPKFAPDIPDIKPLDSFIPDIPTSRQIVLETSRQIAREREIIQGIARWNNAKR